VSGRDRGWNGAIGKRNDQFPVGSQCGSGSEVRANRGNKGCSRCSSFCAVSLHMRRIIPIYRTTRNRKNSGNSKSNQGITWKARRNCCGTRAGTGAFSDIRFTIKPSALLGWKHSPPDCYFILRRIAWILGLAVQLPANMRQQGLPPMPMAIFRIHFGAVATATLRRQPAKSAGMVDLIQFV
jgi:hypothetical protein